MTGSKDYHGTGPYEPILSPSQQRLAGIGPEDVPTNIAEDVLQLGKKLVEWLISRGSQGKE